MCSVLKFVPFPSIQTERLVLRDMKMQDAEDILIQRSHPIINKYIHRDPAKNLEDALNYLVKISLQQQQNTSVTWAITLKDSNKFVGLICLWNINETESSAELGYSLHPDYFRMGIMKEAAQQVLKYGFDTLRVKRIDAYTHKDNLASQTLLKRLNFKRNLSLEENLPDKSELEYNQIFSLFE